MPSTETPDSTIFELLQKEFCHTLDSSLIAALLFDVEESDVDGNPVTPTTDQIRSLRGMLKQLSLQAEECSRIEYFSDVDNTLREQTTSSCTPPSSFGVDTEKDEGNSLAECSQVSESSSSSSSRSFYSPLGFLQMVLPDVPSARLRKALETHDGEDLWDIIAFVVAEEAIHETEERGLEGSGYDETGWGVIQRNKEKAGMAAPKKKTPIKPKKLVLADIRQQHHEKNIEHWPSRRRDGSNPGVPSSQSAPSMVDPWTWISSLSTRLASLLPPHSPTTFSSFLHSPQYLTSYDAVRACLTSLCKSNELSDRQTTLLINLLDIIVPEDDKLDVAKRSQVISDVELAVCLTEGRGDNALDLAYLLRDLDGPTGAGLNGFHSQLSPKMTLFQGLPPSLSSDARGLSQRNAPPDNPPTPSLWGEAHLSSKRSSLKANTHQWQTVPFRAKRSHSARCIGSYVNGNKTARPGFANHSSNLSASEKEENDNTNDSKLRVRQAMVKSRQALMDAAIMYQRHNSKNCGGQVALYYAERAREWKQIAKREALNATRERVLANSERQGKDVIDLHGTTVAEALVIVREILTQRSDSTSSEKPLRIVTGKGNHSAGGASVLKPALQNALAKDGWTVTTWDAGLVIRGARV